MLRRSVSSTHARLLLGTVTADLLQLCSTPCGCRKEAHRGLETVASAIE